jgi:hypothetical protein
MPDGRDRMLTLRYIDQARGRFLNVQSEVERSRYAWAYLRGMRRLGDDPLCKSLGIAVPVSPTAPGDLNLAAAEHYMYARFLAGSTGDPSSSTLVYGYELWKAVRFVTGREAKLRTDPRFPVLPPSVDSVNWGVRGVDDGLRDYRGEHGGKTGEIGSALRANKDLISGQAKY